MKFGSLIRILAIFTLALCIAQPILAEETPASDVATALYNLGEKSLSTSDYQGAIDYFDRALAANTTNLKLGDALLYLYRDKAYAQIQLGKNTEAIATIDEGLKLYPKDNKLWNNRGYASYKLGAYQDALDSYNKAISFERDYTKAFINKGDTLSKMGRYQEAVDAYNQALASDPGNKDALAGLETAKSGAAQASQTTLIIVMIVIVVAAGGALWYFRFRKPAVETPEEKKSKGKKK
jgi:tetratricopeptide (TPR) repeat protein